MEPELQERPQVTSEGQAAAGRRQRNALEPTVEAAQLAEPVEPVTVPEPARSNIPQRTGAMVNNVLGSIRSTSERARELEENNQMIGNFVDESSGFDIQNEQLARFGVTPERIAQLGEIEQQLAGMNTDSALTQTRIQGAAGQTMNQGAREVTQEQRENAVRSAGLAAQAAVLQNNINLGRELARDAVNIALADRDFKYKNLIAQNQQLQGQVDEETRQLLVAEQRGYEAELAKDEEVKRNVESAVVSGAASQEEIAQLNAILPTHPDPVVEERLQNEAIEQKNALARSITARGAGEMRDLEIEDARSNIAARNAGVSQGWARINMEERKFNYQQQQNALATELAALQEAGTITKEQAANQQKVESALRLQDLTSQIRGHAGFNLSVGSVGSRVFSLTEGGIAGQVYNYLSGQGEGFDALYDQLTESLTLDNLDKMSGVLTDRDIQVLRSAATRLRKTTTESEFLNTLDEMDSIFQRTVDENGVTPQQAQFYFGLEPSSLSEIDALFGESSPTPAASTIGSSFDF